MSEIFTIGFTDKSAREFFYLISQNNVKRIIDTRINTGSQLSGFAKKNDLQYFLKEICNVDYVWVADFAPTKDLLSRYRSNGITWTEYENLYVDLIIKRKVEKKYSPEFLDGSCLLCSEHQPHFCHRRLLVEYLNLSWGSSFEVKHLL
ncbi:DUF488 domain-containing protein [Iodobacter fluviatilis]|uniref:DUF488 domain-containing protein n=1 Tax=Iodobacter fluviatilis TaxID=537 RepID=A0A7G3G8X4_9NEIS|nr:DUF488 domain-containing protein [Iodobacter fluviatilis]QBC43721.1 hypothetical protein C1H71_09290 [Iodobacter fluviatilis]